MKLPKIENGLPWKRILKEHVLDMLVGAFIGIWLADMFDIGIIEYIKQLGGLAVISSFIAVMHRIFYNGKAG